MAKQTLYTNIKRVMDIVMALGFIIVFSPIYIVTAILIWMQDWHNPFYTQVRMGENEKPFNFYKFRSMVINADAILEVDKKLYEQLRSGSNKVKDDPRITKIGKFIRKYSIDEFPQMINVLKGEMSVIGPRSLRPDEFEMYKNQSPENAKKLKKIAIVKPGITGYWQVSGRSKINFDQRMDMDCYYVDNLSLMFDLKIMVKTPLAVLKGEGAY